MTNFKQVFGDLANFCKIFLSPN